MNEETVRTEVQKMFRAIGWNDYHPPDVSFRGAPTAGVSMGRPDIYLLNSVGPSAVCEVKTCSIVTRIESHLDPKRLSTKQRRWLDWWTYGRKGMALLAVGTLDRPRRLLVIPWDIYVNEEFAQRNREALVDGVDLESLDAKVGLPHKMPLSLFDAYGFECTWATLGTWVMPAGHPMFAIKTMLHNKDQWNQASLRTEEEDG